MTRKKEQKIQRSENEANQLRYSLARNALAQTSQQAGIDSERRPSAHPQR